ncbi:hypothetical protein BDV09DRAFT_200311 [Aspergillus tetrazonus]
MSSARSVSHLAFIEEYDEDAEAILPDIARSRHPYSNQAFNGHMTDTKMSQWIASLRDLLDVRAELARVCLIYLCYNDFSTNYVEPGDQLLQRFEEYKFLRYAVQGWCAHAHLSEPDDDVFTLAMKLLKDEEGRENFGLWCHLYLHLHKAAGQRPKISDTSPLYFASLFGLPRVVLTLLEGDPDLDKRALEGCIVRRTRRDRQSAS